MSTREMAYEIVDQFTEEQLQAFLVLYGKGSTTFRRERDPEKVKALEELDAIVEAANARNEAFQQIMQMRKEVPDFDEKAELAAYREEKYGK